jgi:hypothetical protein
MTFHRARNNLLRLAPLLLCSWVAACEQGRLTLKPESCTTVSDQQKLWLTQEWSQFSRYVRACPVKESTEKTAIVLVSIDAAGYYKDQAGTDAPQVRFPRPILFSPTGKVLGRLPYNFPDDPPTELRVTFSDWRGGFPMRVDMFIKDPAAGGDRNLRPLVWNRQREEYQQPPKEKK